MSLGLIGKKQGMTRFFTEEGGSLPVTVVSVDTNTIIQIKTIDKDGYNSIQLGFDDKKEKTSNKAELGHIKKANTSAKKIYVEFKSNFISRSWF